MSPSGSLPGFRESARDLPGVCQALAESRKAQSLASKISTAFMGRLERLETAMGRPGKACGNHGKIPWEGVGRRGQAWEEVWEGLPMGRPSHGRSAFRDTASLPGEGGLGSVY